MSTQYKVLGRWHLSARVFRVWHSNRHKAGKKEMPKWLIIINQHEKTL